MAEALNMDSRGSGNPPVLLLHSFAGDCSHWTPVLEHLASRQRVVAFDFSGHGLCTERPYVQGLGDAAPFHPNGTGQLVIALADERALLGAP